MDDADARTALAEPGEDSVSLTGSRPTHPALARAHDAVTGRSDHSEITSYDRMHHRHNRS